MFFTGHIPKLAGNSIDQIAQRLKRLKSTETKETQEHGD